MKNRIRTQEKRTGDQTPDSSTASAQSMFQSRPFVVQTQQAEQSQQPDLKTALMRAERYGHHLSQMHPAGVSVPKTIQPKQGNGQHVESESSNAPQVLQAASAQKGESEALGMENSTSGVHQENQTGMPDHLKAGVETLSGLYLNDVKVHYNSAKPAQLHAHAYTHGIDIHIEQGQEKHLPHEAWHVAQQKQGRVKPTVQVKGAEINDDAGLEKEADVMGAKAYQVGGETLQRKEVNGAYSSENNTNLIPFPESSSTSLGDSYASNIVQRVKKAPDRPLSQVDDPEWERAWGAKQEEVHNAMQAFVPRFLALDPNAEVRIRGSLASGIKGNKNKVDLATGERLLFNPTDFDIDAYVASDKLYREVIENGGDDAALRGQVAGSHHPKVNKIIRDMRKVLATIEGNRDAPHPQNSWKFNVLIRSQRNAEGTIKRDRNAMRDLGKPPSWGNPLTVERPDK